MYVNMHEYFCKVILCVGVDVLFLPTQVLMFIEYTINHSVLKFVLSFCNGLGGTHSFDNRILCFCKRIDHSFITCCRFLHISASDQRFQKIKRLKSTHRHTQTYTSIYLSIYLSVREYISILYIESCILIYLSIYEYIHFFILLSLPLFIYLSKDI